MRRLPARSNRAGRTAQHFGAAEGLFGRSCPAAGPPSERPSLNTRTIVRLVRAAFGQRRKTLSNSLDGVATIAEIETAGIDPRTRAEQLSPQAYVELARIVDAS